MLVLLKDALRFFKFNWLALAGLLFPLALVSIALTEATQLKAVIESMASASQNQESQGIESIWAALDIGTLQGLGILFYFALALLPTALVILYIQANLANKPESHSVYYRQGIVLWAQVVGFYLLLGLVLLASMSGLMVIASLVGSTGVDQLIAVLELVIPFLGLYVSYRLSFMPYLLANQRLSYKKVAMLSWRLTGPFLTKLILGSLLIYTFIFMLNSLINTLLEFIMPLELIQESIVIYVGQVLGAIHTIYFYRVFSLSEADDVSQQAEV